MKKQRTLVLSLIIGLVSIAAYAFLSGLWNAQGECVYVMGQYCSGLFDVRLPEFWKVGMETLLPVSPFIGIFCALVAYYLLLAKD